jgi:gluconokinase
MGVAGAGKSTVGARLAAVLDWPFLDADALHPRENVEKMRRGVALTDADRDPWLTHVRKRIEDYVRAEQSAVVACSALRRAYRERLRIDPAVRFVFLKGDSALLLDRLNRRVGHFVKAPLLASQLHALEEPVDAVTIDAALPVDDIVKRIRVALNCPRPTR